MPAVMSAVSLHTDHRSYGGRDDWDYFFPSIIMFDIIIINDSLLLLLQLSVQSSMVILVTFMSCRDLAKGSPNHNTVFLLKIRPF